MLLLYHMAALALRSPVRQLTIIIPRPRMSIALRPKSELAIDSDAMRARAIIVLVKSNKLVQNIEKKKF